MRRQLLFVMLAVLTTATGWAQTAAYATIPTGTDLYSYFQSNPVPGGATPTVYDLAAGGQYTLSQPVSFDYNKVTLRSADAASKATITMADGAGFVTGNSFALENINVDCAATTQPVITLYNYSTDPDGVLEKPANFYLIDAVTLKGCTFTDVRGSLLYDSGKPYCILALTIDDCIIRLNSLEYTVKNAAFISLHGGGVKDFVMQNSTAYQVGTPINGYFIRYSQMLRVDRITGSTDDFTTVSYINNTFYKVLDINEGQWYNGSGIRNYCKYYILKNIWYDADNGQTARRILSTSSSLGTNSSAIWKYNTYFKNGEAVDQKPYDDSGTALTTDPGFANPSAGDFTISGAQQVQYGTGDSRWGGWVSEIVETDIADISYLLDSFTYEATLLHCNSSESTISIPSTVSYNGKDYTVTTIEKEAFSQCAMLESVSIPATVTKLGEGIFQGCRLLTSVTLPEGMTEIPINMFNSCYALTSINLPSTLTTIGGGAFRYCSLTSINLPSTLTTIGESAFSFCSKLASINLPQGLKVIGSGAFSHCRQLTQVNLPQGLEAIGTEAFYDCGLSVVNIPASVTLISPSAFIGVSQAINVDAANGNYSSQDGILFDKAKTILMQAPFGLSGAYNIPATVTAIDVNAFAYCENLTQVSLPAGLLTIGQSAFYNTTALTSITLPQSLTTIGSDAFNFSGLTGYVDIPASVTNDWFWAFNRCANLRGLNVAEDNPMACSDQGVIYNKEKTQLILMTQGFEGDYNILPTTTTIGYYKINEEYGSLDYFFSAISQCSKLTSLHIPASVSVIVSASLRKNPNLSTITVDGGSPYFCTQDGALFDKQMKTMYWIAENRSGAFQIPDGVEALTDLLFYFTSQLRHITVPASVSKLGGNCFNCKDLEAISWLREEPLKLEPDTYQYGYEWRYNMGGSLSRAFIMGEYRDVEPYDYVTYDCTLYVPDGSVDAYKNDNEWGSLGFNIQPLSADGIEEATTATSQGATPTAFYSLDGKRHSTAQPGVNIVRMSDGTTRKVVIK